MDMDDMRQCMDEVILGGGAREPLGIDCDSRAAAYMCAHLTDLHALDQLRRHPGRVYSPHESSLHIVGITPTLSLYTSMMLEADTKGEFAACAASVRRRPHAQRLAEVGPLIRKQIRGLPLGSSRMYLIVHSAWQWDSLLPLVPLLRSMQSPSSRVQMRVAVVDPFFAYEKQRHGYSVRQTVVTPYVASHAIEQVARQQHNQTPLAVSRTLFFAGAMGSDRFREGRLRQHVLGALAVGSRRASISGWARGDVAESGPLAMVRQPPRGYAAVTRSYVAGLTSSVFCPSPAGDTPTSRRYFDVLGAGCLPVHFGALAPFVRALPFQRQVYWPGLMLFAGNMTCLAANKGRVVKLLGAWLDDVATAHRERLWRTSEHGRRMFLRYLSWAEGGGALDSLLAELHCQQHRARLIDTYSV
jgi:hypothetical protein